MNFEYFLYNQDIKPISQAAIPVNNIHFSYGFGVYESLKIRKGKIFFLKKHLQRLQKSANEINLNYDFYESKMTQNIQKFFSFLNKTYYQNPEKEFSCNLKIILIGKSDGGSDLYLFASAPKFVDKKLYKKGSEVIALQYQRFLPNCKSLNMLPSYLAYKEAQKRNFYDSLLIDPKGNILEGTRTNFFATKNKTIFSPRKIDILEGVTYQTVLEVALKNGYKFEEKDLQLEDIGDYESIFLTSTSAKILPIKTILIPDSKEILPVFNLNSPLKKIDFQISTDLKNLIQLYETFLDDFRN